MSHKSPSLELPRPWGYEDAPLLECKGQNSLRFAECLTHMRQGESVDRPTVIDLLEEASPFLLYTSAAADDLPCVDLGGRYIIKKH